MPDMSQGRAKLIKALLGQTPECKLFAVGDDGSLSIDSLAPI